MDYKKKYDQALENLKRIKTANEDNKELVNFIEYEYPELKESEDERIKNLMIKVFKSYQNPSYHINTDKWEGMEISKILSWLEKQGKQKPKTKPALEVWKDMRFEVYQQASGNRHEPNYSDDSTKMFSLTDIDEIFEKVAEKQGEQMPTYKIEPKFKVGDYIWTIQDAKDGDVLALNGEVFIYAHRKQMYPIAVAHCFVDSTGKFCHDGEFGYIENGNSISPATKEQRDLLFFKMKEAGYEWDAEKKELKMAESVQPELPNGEDYGIDSLYHAERILEKTLGEVEGYQSDDGILEHKCAIEAVKRLYKQKPTWSEEDEHILEAIIKEIEANKTAGPEYDEKVYDMFLSWLKSLKERYTWKPSDEQMEALYTYIYNPQYFNSPDPRMELVESVYKDLKKLREE